MTATTTTDIYTRAREEFLARMDHLIASLNGMSDHPAFSLRHHARQSLAGTSFPDRKNEDWKYTSVRSILANTYGEAETSQPSAVPVLSPDACNLVFTNGVWDKVMSDPLPEGMSFGTLEEAFNTEQTHAAASTCLQR
ncbi:MAG: hypothetical protein R3330_10045, partial [Saprospiraceae bacterium]|nr:hypothetical protein [Saprospiraceae bacterium]